jgi:hypothetical protein
VLVLSEAVLVLVIASRNADRATITSTSASTKETLEAHLQFLEQPNIRAAVELQILTGDEPRAAAAQEGAGVADFFRAA